MTEDGAGVTVREKFVESTLKVFGCECECEYGLCIWMWMWMWMWINRQKEDGREKKGGKAGKEKRKEEKRAEEKKFVII